MGRLIRQDDRPAGRVSPKPMKIASKLDLETQSAEQALDRLLSIAATDTGQARRVADFLLAWHNAAENGGWDPVELWAVADAIANDMLVVLRLIRYSHRYPAELGLGKRIEAIWNTWRATPDR